MSDFRVASRYAKSLFDLALELKKVEKIHKDMQLVGSVCSENRKLVLLLKNPILKQDVKIRVLTKIFQKQTDPITINFFKLICRKNRADVLPEICAVFLNLYDLDKGIIRANVASAVKLSPEIQKEFENILSKETGKKVELETTVDETLLGGYVLRVGDNQIDDSLKTKINNLRRELKHRP